MRKYNYKKYSTVLFLVAFLLFPTKKLKPNVLGFIPNTLTGSIQDENNEAALKSVYMYNFTRYIEWKRTPDNKFVILVIGDSPIIAMLNVIAKNKMVDGMQIIVKKVNDNIDVRGCDMIYVPASQNDKLPAILLKMDNITNALVVSEMPGDAEQGADINFVLDGNKLKFEINNFSLKKHGLKASSQLLKLAVNVFE